MHILRVLIFALLLPASFAAEAKAPCASDLELKSVLVEVYFSGLRQQVEMCARRFPHMASNAGSLLHKLDARYGALLVLDDWLSIQPFERVSPGHGRENRDENTRLVTKPSRDAAQGYDQTECEKVVLALEASIVADDWKVVTTFPQLMFRQERARTPVCPATLGDLFQLSPATSRVIDKAIGGFLAGMFFALIGWAWWAANRKAPTAPPKPPRVTGAKKASLQKRLDTLR